MISKCLMRSKFDRDLALVNCRVFTHCLQVFIHLYIGRKQMLRVCQRIIESLEKFDHSTLICCLFWLMSYEGMYLNHFLEDELTFLFQRNRCSFVHFHMGMLE